MLNENIKALRKTKGYSQEELAAELGVVRQTVSKWEKGLSVPDAQLLIRLAEVLGTNVECLVGDELPQSDDHSAVTELEKRLGQIEGRLTEQKESRRKAWRAVSFTALILALMGLLPGLFGAIHSCRFDKAVEDSVAMIGGADGPTAIFVSGMPANHWGTIAAAAVIIISLAGIYATGRRHN